MKILIAESNGFSTDALATLRGVGEVVEADLDRAGLLRAIADADILWVRLRTRIDEEVLDAGKNLQMIVSATTGLNHIDVEEATRRGIRVVSLRGEEEFLRDIRATAELTIGLLLSLLRHIPQAVDEARQGNWDRDLFQGRELYGKTAGIVGYGRLGRIVARYLQAFGMRVLAADPHVDPSEIEAGVTLVPLAELLAESHVVSIHVNLCDETASFFGRAEFAAMRQGAWFVNTARGEVIDEAALIAALDSGRVAAAALDVVAGEDSRGMGAHPLIEYARRSPRVIVTPHIGGCTQESMAKTECFLAGRVASAIATRTT